MGFVAEALFDRGGLLAALDNLKNLVAATLLVAAGFEAASRVDIIKVPGLQNAPFAGYAVAGAGCLLILLNFIDGWRKLSRLPRHLALRAGLIIAYPVFSVRVVQLIILFRTHTCSMIFNIRAQCSIALTRTTRGLIAGSLEATNR